MAPLPSEVKAVAALLDEPAEDVKQLAKDVIELVDTLRHERQQWVIAVHDGDMTTIYGPYPTVAQAKRDVGNNVFASRPDARGGLYPLHRAERE